MKAYIDEFTAIAALLPNAPAFYHESVQMQNIKADNLTAAYLFAPSLGIGKYKKEGGGFRPTMKVIIEFLKLTPFENDLTQNQAIIQAMEDLAVDFMQRMNLSTVLTHPTEYETNYVYERFDSNMAGIALTFDCSLKQPLTSCV